MKILPQFCCTCRRKLKENSVILLCDCAVCLCQDCAKQQISEKEGTYESFLSCPACPLLTSLHNIIEGKKEAQAFENELIRRACTHFNVAPRKKDNFTSLVEKFADHFSNELITESYFSNNWNLRKLRLARLALMLNDHCAELGNPLDKVRFKSNTVLEKTIAICEGYEECDLSEACIVCSEDIRDGDSVQFLCECVVNIMCRSCALNTIANQENTYHEGISCPTCRQQSFVLENVAEAKKMETRLLADGMRHFGMKNTKGRSKSFDSLHKLYVDYYHAGLRGTINPDHYLTENPGLSKTCTVSMIRLELARLELLRANGLGNSPDPSNPHRYLGPLSVIRIKRNQFLEIFLRNVKPHVKQTERCAPHWLDADSAVSGSPGHASSDSDSDSDSDPEVDGGELGRQGARRSSLSGMLRAASTPCPHCEVDTFSARYLRRHLRTYHRENAAAVQV